MREYHFFVYILTSYNGNAMYIGVTSDLIRRVYEHKSGMIEGFTKQYRVHQLVYFEQFEDVRAALEREKQLKKWSRAKRNGLVETANPEWKEILLSDMM